MSSFSGQIGVSEAASSTDLTALRLRVEWGPLAQLRPHTAQGWAAVHGRPRGLPLRFISAGSLITVLTDLRFISISYMLLLFTLCILINEMRYELWVNEL